MTLLVLVHRTVSTPVVVAAEVLTAAVSAATLSLLVGAHLAAAESVSSAAADDSADATVTVAALAALAMLAVVGATVRSVHDAGRPALAALIALGADPAAVVRAFATRSALVAAGGAALAGTALVPALAPVTARAWIFLLDGGARALSPPAGALAWAIVATSLVVVGTAFVSARVVAGLAALDQPAAAARAPRPRRVLVGLRVGTALAVTVTTVGPVVVVALLSDRLGPTLRALDSSLTADDLRSLDELGTMPPSSWAIGVMSAALLASITSLALVMPVIAPVSLRFVGWAAPRGGPIWHLARNVALARVAVTSASATATALVVGAVATIQASFDLARMVSFELQTTVEAQWLEIAWMVGPLLAICLSGGAAAALVASRHDAGDWVVLAGLGLDRRRARLVPLAQALLQCVAASLPALVLAGSMTALAGALAMAMGSPVEPVVPDAGPAGAAFLLCLAVTVTVSMRRFPDALGRGTGAGGRLLL